jgi:flagellar hook protein FlgE
MTALLDIASEGMRRSARAIDTIARNIANVETEGYRTQRHDPSTGVDQARTGMSQSPLRQGTPEEGSASDVDLATEFVDLRRQQTTYDANAAVIRVGDRMIGELLDLVG